jgi:hypothetical protein
VASVVVGCGSTSDPAADPAGGSTAGQTAGEQTPTQEVPVSPPPATEGPGATPPVPVTPRPTSPPKQPTDVFVRSRVEGTVVAPSAPGCVDLVATNGVRWTLLGPLAERLEVGQHVRLTVRGEPRADPRCEGAAARVEAVVVIG